MAGVKEMSIERRIEKLERQAGAKDDLLIFVYVMPDERSGIRPTEEELELLQKEAMDKNPGQKAYVVRWEPRDSTRRHSQTVPRGL